MTDYREPEWDTTAHSQRGVWTTRPSPTNAVPTSIRAAVPPPSLRLAPMVRREPAPRIRRVLRVALGVVAALCLLLGTMIFAGRWIAPPTSTLMLAQRLAGSPITRRWRPVVQISPHLARAVIMSEDAGFCGHRGVDFGELERAYERGLDGSSNRGASTISMQTIKNLFLWPSRSYLRKVIEIPLTLAADGWWGKRRMLEVYLNIVEWGPGVFGAEAAAETYFHKPARDLTEAEAALMAVSLPNPLVRNPAKPSALHRRLASVVQGRMQNGEKNVRCLTSAAPPGV